MLWKRKEIAPKQQFLLFSTTFSIHLTLAISNYCLSQTRLLILVLFCFIYSLHFNSCYLKLLLSQTENYGPLEFELMRVHCMFEKKVFADDL